MRRFDEIAQADHLHVCQYAPDGYRQHVGRIVGEFTPANHCVVEVQGQPRLLRFAPHWDPNPDSQRQLSRQFETPSQAAGIHERHLAALATRALIDHLDTEIVGVRDNDQDEARAGLYYTSQLLPPAARNLRYTEIDGTPVYERLAHYGAWLLEEGEEVALYDLDDPFQHHVLLTPLPHFMLHDPEPQYSRLGPHASAAAIDSVIRSSGPTVWWPNLPADAEDWSESRVEWVEEHRYT